MRIASYNLFEGAQDTYPLLNKFVRQQEIDVICLQEVNGWQDNSFSRIQDFAATSGLGNHVFGNSNTQFKLAIFSRLPIKTSHVYTKEFWHCAIQATIDDDGKDLEIWDLHLNPGNEASRLIEARTVAPLVSKHALLAGDMNSLSRADSYSNDLITKLTKLGITKFGTDFLRYDTTDFLGAHGFIDVAALLASQDSTVPTQTNQDMYHADMLRLDYFWATPSLATHVRNVEVIKDELTDAISDHYPIVATIE